MCAEYIDTNTCFSCLEGYHLDDLDSCVLNPRDQIINCKVYSSFDSCIECNLGFYPKVSTYCELSPKIDGCQILKSKSNLGGCAECVEGKFYSSTLGQCHERSFTIKDCAQYDTQRDQCAVCSPGFKLSRDLRVCKPTVTNCLISEDFFSDSEKEKLDCLRC